MLKVKQQFIWAFQIDHVTEVKQSLIFICFDTGTADLYLPFQMNSVRCLIVSSSYLSPRLPEVCQDLDLFRKNHLQFPPDFYKYRYLLGLAGWG